jgi:hypothetical protein
MDYVGKMDRTCRLIMGSLRSGYLTAGQIHSFIDVSRDQFDEPGSILKTKQPMEGGDNQQTK